MDQAESGLPARGSAASPTTLPGGAVRSLASFGRSDLASAGGKGASLGELVRAGLPVPDGFVVTTAAYLNHVQRNGLSEAIVRAASAAAGRPDGDDEAAATIRSLLLAAPVERSLSDGLTAAYDALGGGAVAVRSSATAEDLPGASFAGQQDTYLNVQGPAALLAAVTRCWSSLWTARALAYRRRQGLDPASVSIAVVVQRLVDADRSGVMFTANPGNGRRDETVIAAAWGLGESVVGGTVDTDTLVLRHGDHAVLSRTTADKAVQTVRVSPASGPGGVEEREVPLARRTAPVLDDAAARELAALGERIERLFGGPQDIEWARAGGTFAVLQARPVTALATPAGAESDPATDWEVPDRTALYFRASIVEQLPDPLTPLFADLVDVAVSRSVTALLQEVLGRTILVPGDVTLPTVNGYAYYAYSRRALCRATLATPKALGLLMTHSERLGLARWRGFALPRYRAAVAAWRGRPLAELPADELLDGLQSLLYAGAEYYTAVQAVIPVAVTSEGVFSACYSALVRGPADPPPTTLLLGFDSVPILAERSLFDLAQWSRGRPELARRLESESTADLLARVRLSEPGKGTAEAEGDWAGFRSRLQEHLDRYGHLVYNLDFANAVPADDPAPLVDALRRYLLGQGGDPYARQRRTAEQRENATGLIQDRLDPVRRSIFTGLLRWAQRVGPERENALAEVGLAWPQLRRILAELGRRLVAAGQLPEPDDIFWLTADELHSALVPAGPVGGAGQPGSASRRSDSGPSESGPGPSELAARRALWAHRRRLHPPQWLPRGSMVHWVERWMPATSGDQTGSVLKGVGASSGRVTATARVVLGPQDFARLQSGEVLVTAITTPAWTPIFARAGAVVTDIGGPLSHSSIVAREYGIPAVLGTGAGTLRVRDGQRVTVDGDAGTVTLLDAIGRPQGEPGEDPVTSGRHGAAGREDGATDAAAAAPPTVSAGSVRGRGRRDLAAAAVLVAAAYWLCRRRRPGSGGG